MPESVNRRSSSGPTIGATVSRSSACLGSVAMAQRVRACHDLGSMTVRIRLFAQLRERAGRSELELELPEGARVRDAIAALGDLAAGLPVVMAINREYADEEAALS